MGMLILLSGIFIEISVAILTIVSKSNQHNFKNIIRIVAFLVFTFLTTLSVIEWSYRYYPLAFLLLLLALIGTHGLLRTRPKTNAYDLVGALGRALGMSVLIFIVTLPAIIFPQHTEIKSTGKYQVATANYIYTDINRLETYVTTGENRKLNVQLWFPENAEGTYPLIIFSHGGLGIKASNETLYNELASHGYIVCSIDHTYQCLYTTAENGSIIWVAKSYRKELTAENAKLNKQQSLDYYQKWMKIRTDDINFVIDYLLSQAKKNSNRVYQLVDTTKIGVIGHSLGGSAALGIGRIRNDVGAVVALDSPFMCDIKAVRNNEFVFSDAKYPVALLNVYSDRPYEHLDDWPQYAQNYTLLTSSNSNIFNVYISGVGHFDLTDLSITSPILTRFFNQKKSTTNAKDCLKLINKICLEFFNCYLKGEGEFNSGGIY